MTRLDRPGALAERAAVGLDRAASRGSSAPPRRRSRSKSSMPNRCCAGSGEREERADAVMLRARAASIPSVPAARDEELVRDLDQEPGAVARVVLTSAGAAMVQVDERREAIADDLMRLPPLQVDDEADAAAIVLVAGVVQTLGWR